MSSRKSSASYVQGTNQETASSAEVLVYQGNGVLHPERQPKLPPATGELQNDEGFATFLKKHSSPTHNRVTAGGRIVPMEPRSPPPFSLPAIVKDPPPAVSEGQQLQDFKRCENYDWHATDRNGLDQNPVYLNPLSTQHPNNAIGIGYAAALSRSPIRGVEVNNAMHNSYGAEMTVHNLAEPMTLSQTTRSYYPVQQMGGPVGQQPLQAQQYSMSPYQPNAIMHAAMRIPLSDGYNPAAAWTTHDQSYQQEVMQQVMPTHQLLAAWQKHYNQLDQQLKDIDRHRAMHNLDHHLAEQRRVIVQQRSDAKDTVREYQDMLGLKRMTESSQESFAIGFNVEAPAYVPTSGIITSANNCHKTSFDAIPAMPLIEKPRGSTHRRAIPIVPPPDRRNDHRASQQNGDDSSRVCKKNALDKEAVGRSPTPSEVQHEQSEPPDMMDIVKQCQSFSQDEAAAYMSENQNSGKSLEGVNSNPSSEDSGGALPPVTPVNDNSLRDAIDKYQQLLKAMSQPKGTITTLRQLNGSVVNVEGQGLDLSAVPLPSYLQSQNGWPKTGSTRENATMNGRRAPADNTSRL